VKLAFEYAAVDALSSCDENLKHESAQLWRPRDRHDFGTSRIESTIFDCLDNETCTLNF
jgi:hypothetical protein